jgi:hypothetical protein
MTSLERKEGDILAVWTVSPVAVSPDGEHALLVGGFTCGGLCGGGAFYLFERVRSGWTLVGHKNLWVS